MSQFGERDHRYRVEWLSTDPDYRTVMIAIHDITDLWEESNFQRALSEGKNRFIATISHELRTPLVSVLGFADELQHAAQALDRDSIVTFASLIQRRGREVAHLVDDLLISDPSAIDQLSLRLVVLDLDEVVASVVRDSEVTARTARSGAVVFADDMRTRQIIRNLLTNAARYGGPDIWLDIRTDGNDEVVVAVSDDGPPIVFEGDLFEAYTTGHRDRPGESTGLGLYVSRSLARAMGGELSHIRVNDRTVFELTLPAALDPVAVERSSLTRATDGQRRARQIT